MRPRCGICSVMKQKKNNIYLFGLNIIINNNGE